MSKDEELARLIEAHRSGDDTAFDRLVDLAYDDLHALARRERRRGVPVTLHTTELAHEAYLRLAEKEGGGFNDSAHFYAVVARAMRYVLIDYARSRSASKRGGDRRRVELEPGISAVGPEPLHTLIAVDEALGRLGELNPALVPVVECRYFAGLTESETAAALGLSVSTVQRHWQLARAQLRLELEAGGAAGA